MATLERPLKPQNAVSRALIPFLGAGLALALLGVLVLFLSLNNTNAALRGTTADMINISARLEREQAERLAGDEGLGKSVEGQGATLGTLGKDAVALKSDTAKLQSDSGALRLDTDSLRKDLTSTKSDLSTTSSLAGSLDRQLVALRTAYTATSSDVTAAKANITGLQGSVATVQATVTASQKSITTLQTGQQTADTRFKYQMAADAYGLYWTAAQSTSTEVSNAVLSLLDASVRSTGNARLTTAYTDWLSALGQLSLSPSSSTARANFTAKDDAFMALLFQGLNDVPK